MTASTIQANETTVPMMPCVAVEETAEFFQALGFRVTYKQTKPYIYLSLEWSGFELHFRKPPKDLNPAEENSGGCLVWVDAVAPYHAAFTQAMRETYGKVLATGRPRITRFRAGASRFTLIDPSGNQIAFIQCDEPKELEYGGSQKLQGLARVLDNARIYRDFKYDDRAAFRAVKSGLRKHGATAPAVERALALATLVELAIGMDEREGIEEWTTELSAIRLTADERQRVEGELRNAADLRRWLTEDTR
ncbi:glyoxalase [Embleya sp. NPDC050493]|uniref:glyoxalase n=1 Tax=Embleya sp. NPDC050493 TaxID=3363989 RepID=UPI0037906369